MFILWFHDNIVCNLIEEGSDAKYCFEAVGKTSNGHIVSQDKETNFYRPDKIFSRNCLGGCHLADWRRTTRWNRSFLGIHFLCVWNRDPLRTAVEQRSDRLEYTECRWHRIRRIRAACCRRRWQMSGTRSRFTRITLAWKRRINTARENSMHKGAVYSFRDRMLKKDNNWILLEAQ